MRISGGPSRGRKLSKITNESTRPPLVRMRKSIFSVLGDRVEGSLVLDLYAGTGAFGIEAISRGARGAIFVEYDKATAQSLTQNLKELGFLRQSLILQADAIEACSLSSFLNSRIHDQSQSRIPSLLKEGAIHFVFLDPPFPHLEPGKERDSIVSGIETLRRDPFLAADAELVIRVPKWHQIFENNPEIKSRKYGKSVVHFVSKIEDKPQDASED